MASVRSSRASGTSSNYLSRRGWPGIGRFGFKGAVSASRHDDSQKNIGWMSLFWFDENLFVGSGSALGMTVLL